LAIYDNEIMIRGPRNQQVQDWHLLLPCHIPRHGQDLHLLLVLHVLAQDAIILTINELIKISIEFLHEVLNFNILCQFFL